VDLYSAYRQYNSTTKRSDVDHTCRQVLFPASVRSSVRPSLRWSLTQ